MNGAYVAGAGLWAPGFAGLGAWLGGSADPGVREPAAELLKPRLRRHTAPLTRMLAEVIAQAAGQAGADLGRAGTVYGSAYGEMRTTVELLEALSSVDPLVSPIRFANSVHNAASGHVSIACQCHGFATSIAAGPDTAAMCLVEALAWLSRPSRAAVVVAVADEALPEPFTRWGGFEALAVALCLALEPGPAPLGRIGRPERGPGEHDAFAQAWRRSPAAPLAGIAACLSERRSTRLALGPSGWSVEVEAP